VGGGGRARPGAPGKHRHQQIYIQDFSKYVFKNIKNKYSKLVENGVTTSQATSQALQGATIAKRQKSAPEDGGAPEIAEKGK